MSQPWSQCGGLSSEQIRERLNANPVPDRPRPAGVFLRQAAVLIPLACERGDLSLLFTRRTDLVHSHKGQIAFPGGAIEPQDQTPAEAALRETYEEIGIPPTEVCLLGQLGHFPTVTGFVITPVVGLVPWPYDLHLSPEEVSRVFTIPLAWLSAPENRDEKEMTLPDGRVERVIFFHEYDGEKVWGATARITLWFLNSIGAG